MVDAFENGIMDAEEGAAEMIESLQKVTETFIPTRNEILDGFYIGAIAATKI